MSIYIFFFSKTTPKLFEQALKGLMLSSVKGLAETEMRSLSPVVQNYKQ